MRISAKGRYGLAALICMVKNEFDQVPVSIIADELNLSKIYLEQIFSILRKNGLLTSTKGAQGGYKLAKDPGDINIYQILSVLEQTLFEKTENSFDDTQPFYEEALQETVFTPLDEAVKKKLSSITLKMLVDQVNEKTASSTNFMYYI